MYKKNPKCSLAFGILHTVTLRCTIHTFLEVDQKQGGAEKGRTNTWLGVWLTTSPCDITEGTFVI